MDATAQDPKKKKDNKSSTWRWVLIFLVVLGVGGFIARILSNESLRRDYFWQQFTLALFAVAAVVVLFALFKNRASVELSGPVASVVPSSATGRVSGAAAFLVIILGVLWFLLYPKDQTVWGYIYYENQQPKSGQRAVKDVVVIEPRTDQRSQPTGPEGRFTITNLRFIPNRLIARYSEVNYSFVPPDYKDNEYPVIPPPTVSRPSQRNSVAASEWTESGSKCPNMSTTGYRKVALYVLQKSFAVAPGFENLVVKVTAQNDSEIVDAQKERPDNEGYEDQLQEARVLTRQWAIPSKPDKVEVRLTLCLGRKKTGPPPARNDIVTQYWFEH
jgi:hypothetical protein